MSDYYGSIRLCIGAAGRLAGYPRRRKSLHSHRLSNCTMGLAVGVMTVGSVVGFSPTRAWAAISSVNCGTADLQTAINDASPGDTLNVVGICYGNFIIKDDLNLVGLGGAVLTGGGLGAVVTVDGASVTLSNLTVQNGANQGYGGGIDNEHGTVILTGSSVVDNTAAGESGGGGIFNYYGTMALTDSTVSGNTDDFGTGGIFNQSGNLSVTDSAVTGNIGGGIVNEGGTVSLTNSTLSTNSTNGLTGGIFNGIGTLTVTNSTVANNTSGAGLGGGLFNAGTLIVANSTVANNSVGTGQGGGIFNDGTLSVANSTVSSNSAAHGGGGIFNNSGGIASMAATILANRTSGGDCAGTITDLGYNLADDSTCGLDATSLSNTSAGLDPTGIQYNGGSSETIALESGSPAIGAVDTASMCSTSDQRGVPRPTPCDIGAAQLVIPQAITSPDYATATASFALSFTITTSGVPVSSITIRGQLPKGLKFTRNDNGTATISGTPKKSGIKHLTVTATFGSGSSRYVVTQAFTLTVNPA